MVLRYCWGSAAEYRLSRIKVGGSSFLADGSWIANSSSVAGGSLVVHGWAFVEDSTFGSVVAGGSGFFIHHSSRGG